MPKVFLREHMGQIIIALIIAGVFWGAYLFRVTLVNQFVVPTVKETLENDMFLREPIKDGKFIVVEENEFATNHPIDPEYIKALKTGEHTAEKIKAIVDEQIKPIRNQAKDLENRIGNVEAIHKAESEGYIEVHLYEATNPSDQDVLVLDAEDPVIGHWLRNGHYYQLEPLSRSRGGEEQCVKLRLDKGIQDTKADGRLYTTQFHQLFTGGKSSGLGDAFIRLKGLKSCNE